MRHLLFRTQRNVIALSVRTLRWHCTRDGKIATFATSPVLWSSLHNALTVRLLTLYDALHEAPLGKGRSLPSPIREERTDGTVLSSIPSGREERRASPKRPRDTTRVGLFPGRLREPLRGRGPASAHIRDRDRKWRERKTRCARMRMPFRKRRCADSRRSPHRRSPLL